MSSSASPPFFSSITAPIMSPDALKTSFSLSASNLTWSLTSAASPKAPFRPSVVTLALTLKVSFGVGISSSAVSRVGIINVRVYFPTRVICIFPVFSSRESSTCSSFPTLLKSLSNSLMFMHIFVGCSQTYSSNTVFGHSKSTMATREGSMALRFIPSGVILKVASSIRVDIAEIMFLSRRASANFILNMLYSLL